MSKTASTRRARHRKKVRRCRAPQCIVGITRVLAVPYFDAACKDADDLARMRAWCAKETS